MWNIVCYILFLTCSLFFSSCSSNNNNIDGGDVIYITNRIIPEFNLMDYVDSVEYILLETTDSSLLRGVNKASSDTNYIIVKDQDAKIFTFYRDGRFISEIGKEGRGAEEYIYLSAYYIDRHHNTITILCGATGRLLTYSYNGEYLHTKYIPYIDCNIRTLTPLLDGNILAHYPLNNDIRPSEFEYKLFIPSADSLLPKSLLISAPVVTKGHQGSLLWEPFDFIGNELWATKTFTHDLYKYNNGVLTRVLTFNWDRAIPNLEQLDKYESMEHFEMITSMLKDDFSIGFTAFHYVKECESLFMQRGYSEGVVIYNGEDAFGIDGLIYDKNLNLYSNILSMGITDSRWGYSDAMSLYDMKDSLNSITNIGLKNIILDLKEDYNPIIYRYYLKPNFVELLKENYSTYFE